MLVVMGCVGVGNVYKNVDFIVWVFYVGILLFVFVYDDFVVFYGVGGFYIGGVRWGYIGFGYKKYRVDGVF